MLLSLQLLLEEFELWGAEQIGEGSTAQDVVLNCLNNWLHMPIFCNPGQWHFLKADTLVN